MKKYIISTFVFLLLPTFAFAAFDGVQGIIGSLGNIINALISLVGALGLLYFFWGLSKFILRAGDEKAREEGKQIMMWGIIALFMMVSIWGIVKFFAEDLDVLNTDLSGMWSGFPEPPCDPNEVCT